MRREQVLGWGCERRRATGGGGASYLSKAMVGLQQGTFGDGVLAAAAGGGGSCGQGAENQHLFDKKRKRKLALICEPKSSQN